MSRTAFSPAGIDSSEAERPVLVGATERQSGIRGSVLAMMSHLNIVSPQSGPPASREEAVDGPLVVADVELEPALRIAMGHRKGASFRVKVAGLEIVSSSKLPGDGRITQGIVARFEQAAIAFSGKRMNRLFLLRPAAQWNSFEFHDFSVRGYYEVAEKVNDPQRAAERFRTFVR